MKLWFVIGILLFTIPAHAFDFCTSASRINCVVEGDTVWIKGEKIRLLGIDAPEEGGKCFAERLLSARSSERLRQLLSSGKISITRHGEDYYQRTLARLSVNGVDVGEILLRENLARRWRGKRENWCN